MVRKIGAITIGQSPRLDVVPEMKEVLGQNIEVLESGALDGLTKEDILKFNPQPDDFILVSKLKDGSSVKFGESHIIPRLQACVKKLENEGAELIVFICTGKFPAVFESSKVLLYPQTILHAVVPKLASHGRVGVINPDKDQIRQSIELWGKSVETVEAVAGSPYGNIQEVINAAKDLKEKDVDVIVMDCIGYNIKMKNIVRDITGKPVILPRTLVARVVGEMLD